MSRRRAPPTQGWDDDFAVRRAPPRRAPVEDEELLKLQAAWEPGVEKWRSGPQSAALITFDKILAASAVRRPSAVRGGGVNFDAGLLLEGLRRFDLQAGGRADRVASRGCLDVLGEDAAFSAWTAKWAFVYGFVDREKAKRDREAEERAQAALDAELFGEGDYASQTFGGRPEPWAGGNDGRRGSPSSSSSEDYCRAPGHAGPGRAEVAPPRRASPPPRPRVPPEEAWRALDAKLGGGGRVTFADIPWPGPREPLVDPSAPPAEAKKLWRAALLRWHPDRFSKILARAGADAGRILDEVKAVTQRIVAEKRH